MDDFGHVLAGSPYSPNQEYAYYRCFYWRSEECFVCSFEGYGANSYSSHEVCLVGS